MEVVGMSLFSMNAKEIVENSNFVREPVEKVIDTINKSDKNKIVLTGPRCGGKSIVLKSYEKGLINSDNPSIYVFMDPSLSSFSANENELKLKCELHLCSWILSYIRKNYNDLFELCFVELDNEIKKKNRLLIKYINEGMFGEFDFPFQMILPGDLLGRLIDKMKQVMKFDTVTICLDRFDWVNAGNSQIFQKAISFYFELFDRVILTTDDNDVYNNIDSRRTSLQTNGYDVIDVDYGKDLEVAKRIISADLRYYANNKYKYDRLDGIQLVDLKRLLDKDKYDYLIQKCEGNFELLFSTLRKFYLYNDDSINRIFEYYEEALDSRRRVDDISYARVLHL